MYNLFSHEKKGRCSPETFWKQLNYHSDISICIPEEIGTGTVQTVTLSEGLFVRIWDCSFKNKMRLDCFPDASTDPFFTLVYHLAPDAICLLNKNEPGINVSRLWNTVFFSINSKSYLDVHPDIPMKSFSICFTPEWILSRSTNSGKSGAFILRMLELQDPPFFFESYNAVEGKMVTDIFDCPSNRYPGSLFIRSRVWALVNEFITKASERQSLLAPVLVDIYEERIRQVEAKVIGCIDSGLPNLKDLAREFAFSESTLKRNFKRIFGKSINNYYLNKKMIYARELIKENNRTVTETAYMLGYEKVSHFIYMFKKHTGCLPGSLRRRA
jgi:AraC-like DNA-binding protein